jgi:hypothetical protein
MEKLEFFKANQEKISNLKLTAVKIETQTLYSAWCAGALSESYLRPLDMFWRQLRHVELAQLTSGLWMLHWDRKGKRYAFTHPVTGKTVTEVPPPHAEWNPPTAAIRSG